MNTEKYINNITLEYLLNPILYEKLITEKNNPNQLLLLEDIVFYKQRICKITKDMCKGNYIDNNLKDLFINYAATIVYYLKQLDEKDILQSEYDNINQLDIDSETSTNINEIDIDTEISKKVNEIIINKPKIINNIDNFIKKNNIIPTNKILPTKRIVNINDPILKTKGIKNKKNNPQK